MTTRSIPQVLLRRWRVIATVTLVCIVAALLAANAIPPKYTASTSLVVAPIAADPFGSGGEEVNIRTEREVLGSSEVARRAAEKLGVDFEPDSYLLTQANIAAPSGSEVLEVNVSNTSAEAAADAADALASAYLEFRSAGATEAAERYIAAIDDRLAELEEGDDEAVAEALVTTLSEQRHRLTLLGSDPGRIIGYASVPSAPSSPALIVFLVAGCLGGLLLGGFAALLRERVDRRVRSADRLAVSIGSTVVTAASSDDDEAWRQTAHVLRHHLLYPATGTRIVGLIGRGSSRLRTAAPALAAVLCDTGVTASALAAPTEIGFAIESGWPTADGARCPDVVIADLSSVYSPSHIGTVLERSSAVVIVTDGKTSMREVKQVMNAVDLAGLHHVIGVLVEGASSRHTRARTSDRANVRTAP